MIESRFEKIVVFISMVSMVLFIGFTFYGYVEIPLLKDSNVDNIQDSVSSESYKKTTRIQVDRNLSGQTDITEKIDIETIVNIDDGVARQQKNKTVYRNGNTIKSDSDIKYVVQRNITNLEISDISVVNENISIVNTDILKSFDTRQTETRTFYRSSEESFINLESYDFSDHFISEEFDYVRYKLQVDSNDRIRSYEIKAESNRESILIDTDYKYNSGKIEVEDSTVIGNNLQYSFNSQGPIDAKSLRLNETNKLTVKNSKLMLTRGENISFSGYDIITFNRGSKKHKHIINDQFVVKSVLPN